MESEQNKNAVSIDTLEKLEKTAKNLLDPCVYDFLIVPPKMLKPYQTFSYKNPHLVL